MSSEKEVSARYRAYCDACQAGELGKLKDFWLIPCMFTVDLDDGQPTHNLVQSYDVLEGIYSKEFGGSTGVDKTVIDKEEVKLYGPNAATIETSLSHFAKDKLYDTQRCFYTARRVAGTWMFEVHISTTQRA